MLDRGSVLRCQSFVNKQINGDQMIEKAAATRMRTNIPDVTAEKGKGFFVPYLEAQPGKTHVLSVEKKNLVSRALSAIGRGQRALSRNWAGAVIDTGRWGGIAASWDIPSVSGPNSSSTSWIGIDGGNDGGSKEVLQIGTRQSVDSNGSPTYVAWYEWFAISGQGSSIYEMLIRDETGRPWLLGPGDNVDCAVAYWKDQRQTFGWVRMKNNTTGEEFRLTLPPPIGAKCEGRSVEWIMEAPNEGKLPLAKFKKLVFTSAVAVDLKDNDVDPQKEKYVKCYEIVTKDNKTITKTSITQNCVTIEYQSGVSPDLVS